MFFNVIIRAFIQLLIYKIFIDQRRCKKNLIQFM